MRAAPLLFACTVCLRSDVVEQGPKDAKPSGLLAGAARLRIDPPIGIAQLNWGSQTHVEAEGIDEPGFLVTALVLSDGRQKFVLAEFDQISVEPFASAGDEAAKLLGIPREQVRLSVSHTHAGPLLSPERGPAGAGLSKYERPYEQYKAFVREQIVKTILAAGANLQPAHIGGQRGTGAININRRVRGTASSPPAVGRNPQGFTDRELIVFRIDDAEGRPMAILANFQAHGTVLGYENKLASPDWVGYARKTVEDAFPGALCLYFQGAAGNQGPVEGFSGDVQAAHRLGRHLHRCRNGGHGETHPAGKGTSRHREASQRSLGGSSGRSPAAPLRQSAGQVETTAAGCAGAGRAPDPADRSPGHRLDARRALRRDRSGV
jgi:hypothetical protein